jgi:hypothetical protein
VVRGDVLAGGLAGAEGGGLDGGCGLVVLVSLLDEKGNTALLARDDTDSLFHIINTVFWNLLRSRLAQPEVVVVVPCWRSSPRSAQS